MTPSLPPLITGWFDRRGWSVRRHQQAMLEAAQAGRHALLVAPTGAGKTLAGFLPTLADLAEAPTEGLHSLYISPLKALAVDVQRNLLTPVSEMGLPIRIETRSGDTPSDRKARQRAKPPHILLTTPESLSLLLSYPDADLIFASLKTVIIDEIHAFASGKRGDLLALSLARLQSIAPGLRRVGLSATVGDPDAYRRWLAPAGAQAEVALVEGEPGAAPDLTILMPQDRVPWSGHSGKYAAGQVIDIIRQHRMTLVFCNTRGLAELIFQELWAENEDTLPIGIHHGSLSREARRKVEAAMAAGKLRGLVATASLDLGIDWGDIDCVIQMGAPKGSSRLLQRIGRANHRMDEPSKAIVIPGNRFEYLEAQAAWDAVMSGERDADDFRPGARDVLAQHIMGLACAGPLDPAALLAEIRTATPYDWLDAAQLEDILQFVSTGGYALRAYDRFQRLVRTPEGLWRIAHPRLAQQHRLNAGIIVDQPALDVRFSNGRKLGTVEESFAATLSPGDRFFFSGLSLELVRQTEAELFVKATSQQARIPSWGGTRMAMSTHLAGRVRAFLADPTQWNRFPPDVHEWLAMQAVRSVLPQPEQLLVETFPHEGLHHMVVYSFEGWNAHQSLGMLLTRRMEERGLKPIGFVSNDYALAVYGLEPVTDPRPLFSADILDREFIAWVEESSLLKRAFRDVAVISGLIERQQPGARKTGRQVSFSTDLIYDVLRRYEPEHLLLKAAWADARARMTDVGRLGELIDRASATMLHKPLDRVSPLAVPVLIMIGREHVAGPQTDDSLLAEAESLARIAMTPDAPPG
ncbi:MULTISPECIES: ligase-associated DNA damage response DEXH box helicase [Sphingobium]|uniref:ligase-associated DNA damage response DEXH box helicase n=1 Tax=Sphingobium TaxID=165695 RepID=UPI0015EC0618|nr:MULTISPECIES: ligase-associated DNA damage response DEXH box helicase [Sphingobium]MCW2363045.1 ATP-dependent Lhr-like helicase [Sphingobium sp. B10D3B]MCW2400275.1 ATP-dependent Lhr-like helicase [Sphingobium sp. B10D7B]MCW2407253.1 ATP-dependent Lhr-like helicase [Sphingobium xanthum]